MNMWQVIVFVLTFVAAFTVLHLAAITAVSVGEWVKGRA